MTRLGSVAAIMLMSPGAHMIWQFQEFGADQTTKDSNGSSNNTSPKKVIWSYLDDPYRNGLKNSYIELNHIRNNNPELFAEGITTSKVMCSSWTKRTITLKTDNKSLYLVVNPSPTSEADIAIDNYSNEPLKLLSASYGTNPTISADGSTVKLIAGAYAVFGSENTVDVDHICDEASAKVYGASGRIVIVGEYDNVEVYNMAGMRMGSLEVTSGIYIVNVDGQVHKVIVK